MRSSRLVLLVSTLSGSGCLWVESPTGEEVTPTPTLIATRTPSGSPSPTPAPDAPADWRVSARGDFGAAHLEWEPVAEADQYFVAVVEGPLTGLGIFTSLTSAELPLPEVSIGAFEVRALINGVVFDVSPIIRARVVGEGWSSAGPSTTPIWTTAISSEGYSGSLLAADFDLDGFDDLIAADAPYPYPAGLRLRAFQGAEPGLSTLGTTVIATGSNMLYARTETADVNGDGFPDLLVGASGDPAQVCTWFGSSSDFLTPGNCVETELPQTITTYITALSSLGDIDGDLRDDILVSAYDSNGWGYTRTEVWPGTPSGLSNAAIWSLDVANDLTAPVDDINGDGKRDLLCSAAWPEPTLALFVSTNGTLSTSPAWTFSAPSPYWQVSELDAARDLTGDGVVDVLLGRPNEDLLTLLEGATMDPPNVALEIGGSYSYTYVGKNVGSLPDATRDAFPDVWFTEQSDGIVHLRMLPGGPGGPAPSVAWSVLGREALSLDSNGDGVDEVAVLSWNEWSVRLYPLIDITFPRVDAGEVVMTATATPTIPVGWSVTDASGEDGPCTWSWGDGSETAQPNCVSSIAPAHAYASPGRYTVTVTYTNSVLVYSSSLTTWIVTP